MDFKVSVIIPVYNDQAYIKHSVKSAITLEEVGEVILIDDGSIDNSIQICNELKNFYSNIQVLSHQNNANKGVSASRNLGIFNSNFEFVSFLDADDYYLPNRFESEKEIFATRSDADGVYGCTKAYFENENAKQKFMSRYDSELTTVSEKISPEHLFKALLYGGKGRFHTSAITLRKNVFEKTGYFNEHLKWAEDSELWLKLSLKSNLYSGQIKHPVSIRRVHDNNSIHQVRNAELHRKKMYQYIFKWAIGQHLPFEIKNDFFIALHKFSYGESISVKRLLTKQLRINPEIFLTTFLYKKLYQIFFSS